MIVSAVATVLSAQNMTTTPDLIYGERCFIEKSGAYYQHGNKNGVGSQTWPAASGTQVVYYLHVPTGHTKMDVYITPRMSCALRLIVTDPEENMIVYETESGATGTKQVKLEMMSDFLFTADKWYRFEFSAASGNNTIASIDKLEFYRESNKQITTPAIFMAPSVHLWSSKPADPAAPTGQSYDWAYEEVMFPSQYEKGARYVEALGILKGYMGIQYTESGNRNVIFSMWDNGNTDEDPNLPDYLRSGIMDKDPRVTEERFGGEGTGQKTIFEHGQFYRPDKWVQFLFNARPEIIDVTVSGYNGQDSIIKYQNTITTAWYKMEDDPDWTYISSIRASGSNPYFNGFYSFLENYGDNGTEYVRAYYRHAYMRSIASGKWYNVNHFTFSNTQNSGNRDSRSDFGHGATDVFANAFYLEHGAFTTQVNDSSQYVGIPLDQSCVDTIDIESKIARVDQAILLNNNVQTEANLQNTGEVYDLTKWEVIGFSDQEEEAVANNGLASMAVDGDSKTYWQNKWRNGGVTYPHWIALKAPKAVTVSKIDLSSAKTSYLYWPKSVVVHISTDGVNWSVATDTMLIDKKAKTTTNLNKRISSQYFKVEFVEPYGAMLYINELGLSTDVSTSRLMDYAGNLLENANRFNSYTQEDLKPLAEVYEEGNGNPDNVVDAISKISKTATLLKYGGIKYDDHISSFNVYQLCNRSGNGKLIVSDGKLTIGEADVECALEQYKKKVDVTNMQNNWRLIQCEGEQSSFYIYSPTEKKYLDLSASNLWSVVPKAVTVYNRTSPSPYFYFKQGSYYLSLDPTSAEQPIKAATTLNENAFFYVYDNYYLKPSQIESQALVAEVDDYVKFDSYIKKATEMLKVSEGVVGCPIGDSRTRLQRAASCTIDERHELYEAVDSCETIPFDPTKYCYRLRSLNMASNPYFATTQNATLETQAFANDPSQIWSMRYKSEGLSLSAQDCVFGRLPNYGNSSLNMVKNTDKQRFGKYYFTQYSPGKYMASTNQNGGIAISSRNPGYSASYSLSYAGFELQIADKLDVILGANGLKGINYNFDVVVPEELEVYVVDNVKDGVANLLRVYDRLTAGTPAIIKGQANQTITLQIAAPTGKPLAENLLKGTYFKTELLLDNIYVLQANGTLVKPHTQLLNANDCYLKLKEDEATFETLVLNFSNEPAAVEAVESEEQDNNVIYDLQGRIIPTTAKGIVIKKHRKVLK